MHQGQQGGQGEDDRSGVSREAGGGWGQWGKQRGRGRMGAVR